MTDQLSFGPFDSPKAGEPCTCIEHANAVLRKLADMRLVVSYRRDGPLSAPIPNSGRVVLETQALAKKDVGKKRRTLVANFCPFCGSPYPK